MKTDQSKRKYLKEYKKPDFTIEKTELVFILHEESTRVESRLSIRRLTQDGNAPLILDGVNLSIIELQIDDEYLDDSRISYDGDKLTICDVPHRFMFTASVEIYPAKNTRLEGLYRTQGNYCTQCEAEGFRHITFYIDRPDVMSVFTTTVHAARKAFPYLLSNGNKIDSGVDGDRHWVKWFDPFPKPSYLFALVAGDFARICDHFITRSGRKVELIIYTEHHNRDKCGHAMHSLQKAMKWDEDIFGLEYDLDLYMIVTVDDFNMGAMENKGLNVFNTHYVLANPETATDNDYLGIEGVIAHEYFHNWTGNRVTCRDWFQLSLKEGLTVFRDQKFSSDMMSRSIQRINDVRVLRSHQFSEDAGPMAHPVRPESYLEINNFYTATVYNKGAEVVRMIHTLLGADKFHLGMDLYFERYDGQAVTTDDFVSAMQDASGIDLSRFLRWYEQSGTPGIDIKRIYDAEKQSLVIRVRQIAGHSKGVTNKSFHIPFKMALFDQAGRALPLNEAGNKEQVLDILHEDQSFEFQNIPQLPLLSAFRGFSAPVNFSSDLSLAELARLMAFDSDTFNRWDAAQQLSLQVMLNLIEAEKIEKDDHLESLLTAFDIRLNDDQMDKPLLAEMLQLPGEKYLAEKCSPVNIMKIYKVREFIKLQIAKTFKARFLELYESCHQTTYEVTPEAIGKRSLKNICLGYLTLLQEERYYVMAENQFNHASNMTDQVASLVAIKNQNNATRKRMFSAFYDQWSTTTLVIDKWFTLQAASRYDNALDEILKLEKHPAFNLQNPNRARSLLGSLQSNSVIFHDPSGRGYEFLADKIIELDSQNPQIAARMASAFLNWKKFIPELAEKMKQQVLRIQATADLSNNVTELMASCLADESQK